MYSDFFKNFLAHPDNKDLVKLNDEAAIKSSIRNIILTNPYERPHNPTFGSGLNILLFEPMSDTIEDLIKDKIKYSLSNFEKRVEVQGVRVSADFDKGIYNVEIQYRILNYSTASILNLPLKKIR
jgi:phage baseplate assembly protein W